MLDVIILAGKESAGKGDSPESKALLEINGKPMIRYIVDALKQVKHIGRVVAIGPKEGLDKCLQGEIDVIPDTGRGIMDNVMSGIKYLDARDGLLVCACDIPFITPEAVNDFIEKAIRDKADLCYPIVEKSISIAKFPNLERTYVRIKEGCFTGGNIFYVNPFVAQKCFKTAEKLLRVRKKPLKMARILSLSFILGLVTGRLGLESIERKFSLIMDINAKAIISEYPEISCDIDKAGDAIVAAVYLTNHNHSGFEG